MASLVVSVPDSRLAGDLQPLPDGVQLIVWDMTGPAPRDRIDLVVPPYIGIRDALPHLAGVETRLVQEQSIGYEGLAELLPPGTVFANAASVHETSTAELAVALTLAAQRRLDVFAVDGRRGVWAPMWASSLADRRVMLLGYGGIGTAVARRLAGFEVELVPVASRARDEDGVHVHGVDDLAQLLPTVDVVIASLPGGPTTSGLVDDAFLAALPDGALLVNVGRGTVVDTDALVDHAERGRIRAALDVTEPEPLPEDHPLWRIPGVLVSPHVGGATSAMRPRITRLVREQVERMLRGDPPVNVVIRA